MPLSNLPFEPDIYPDIPHEVYKADPWGPCLSASIAHKLIPPGCPRKAYAAHPRLGACAPADDTIEKDRGTLLHHLLLGGGPEIVIVEADSWRTNAAKAERDAALEAGALPVLADSYQLALGSAEGIKRSLAEEGIFLEDYAHEMVALWLEGDVRCRARLDLVSLQRVPQILDLKIVRSASPSGFANTTLKLGYDIQRAAYCSAVEALHPDLAGRVKMEFILCEAQAPFLVSINPPAATMRGLGRTRWHRAVRAWKECLASGKWPGYGRVATEAPTWALTEDFGQEIAAGGTPDWLEED